MIYFYYVKDKYGCFSNFSPHPIDLDGKLWPTSEHYFQAQKFVTTMPEYSEKIWQASSPMVAARLGRSRKVPLRPDWEQIKDDVMRKAVRSKVLQHDDVREALLSTGNKMIIEKTTKDYYWGCGEKGTGKNMLGKILQEIREEIKPKFS